MSNDKAQTLAQAQNRHLRCLNQFRILNLRLSRPALSRPGRISASLGLESGGRSVVAESKVDPISQMGRGATPCCPPSKSLFSSLLSAPNNLSAAGSGKSTWQFHQDSALPATKREHYAALKGTTSFIRKDRTACPPRVPKAGTSHKRWCQRDLGTNPGQIRATQESCPSRSKQPATPQIYYPQARSPILACQPTRKEEWPQNRPEWASGPVPMRSCPAESRQPVAESEHPGACRSPARL